MNIENRTVKQDLDMLYRMRRIDVGVLADPQFQETLAACDRRMHQLREAQLRIAQLETELAATKLVLETVRISPADSTCLSPRAPPELSPRIDELTPVGSLE